MPDSPHISLEDLRQVLVSAEDYWGTEAGEYTDALDSLIEQLEALRLAAEWVVKSDGVFGLDKLATVLESNPASEPDA